MNWDKKGIHPQNFISGHISFLAFEWLDFDLKVDSNTGEAGGGRRRGVGRCRSRKFILLWPETCATAPRQPRYRRGAREIDYASRTGR